MHYLQHVYFLILFVFFLFLVNIFFFSSFSSSPITDYRAVLFIGFFVFTSVGLIVGLLVSHFFSFFVCARLN